MSLLSLAVLAVGLLTVAALVLLLWPASEGGVAGEGETATEEQGVPSSFPSSTEAIAEEMERGSLNRDQGSAG